MKDDDAFLSLVTPYPIERFFAKEVETLFVHPVWVLGNPGSGKTTVAQVFTLTSVVRLLGATRADAYRDLLAALGDCGAIRSGAPTVNGFRLAMESDYRALWELPYPAAQRHGLLTALVQARAVLGWLRSIEAVDVGLGDVTVHADERAPAMVEQAGAASAEALRSRAREVERVLYNLTSALVPRQMTTEELEVVSAYRPFDTIEAFGMPEGWLGLHDRARLQPLVMLDDVQRLHPEQLSFVREWISRREMVVARWFLTWPDSAPANVAHGATRTLRGPPTTRELTVVRLGGVPALDERKAFERAASDMASRYLSRMHIFEARGIRSLEELLGTAVPQAAKRVLERLRSENDAAARAAGLSVEQRRELRGLVDEYARSTKAENVGEDVLLAMEAILLARIAGGRQRSLFGSLSGQEPMKPMKVDGSVAEGARVRLAREFERPLYFGVGALTAAGTLNAELFLRLTSTLVERSMTQITRRDAKALSAVVQDALLREASADVQALWDFAGAADVRALLRGVVDRCVEVTSRPNAPLGGGANAYGIMMEEYAALGVDASEGGCRLRRCLQRAAAQTAVVLSLDYSCKNKNWCIIELGGPAIIANRLTLRKGGFVEGTVQELSGFLRDSK